MSVSAFSIRQFASRLTPKRSDDLEQTTPSSRRSFSLANERILGGHIESAKNDSKINTIDGSNRRQRLRPIPGSNSFAFQSLVFLSFGFEISERCIFKIWCLGTTTRVERGSRPRNWSRPPKSVPPKIDLPAFQIDLSNFNIQSTVVERIHKDHRHLSRAQLGGKVVGNHGGPTCLCQSRPRRFPTTHPMQKISWDISLQLEHENRRQFQKPSMPSLYISTA